MSSHWQEILFGLLDGRETTEADAGRLQDAVSGVAGKEEAAKWLQLEYLLGKHLRRPDEKQLNLMKERLKARALLREKFRTTTSKYVRRRRWGRVLAAGIAAALILAVGAWYGLTSGHLGFGRAGEERIAVETQDVPGTRLTTGAEEALVSLGGYCTVAVGPDSEIVLEGAGFKQQIYLARGRVVCEVVPGAGEFAVRTDIGSVVVTGTKFSVELAAPQEGGDIEKRLVVAVREGSVEVSGRWGRNPLQAGQEGAFTENGLVALPTVPADGPVDESEDVSPEAAAVSETTGAVMEDVEEAVPAEIRDTVTQAGDREEVDAGETLPSVDEIREAPEEPVFAAEIETAKEALNSALDETRKLLDTAPENVQPLLDDAVARIEKSNAGALQELAASLENARVQEDMQTEDLVKTIIADARAAQIEILQEVRKELPADTAASVADIVESLQKTAGGPPQPSSTAEPEVDPGIEPAVEPGAEPDAGPGVEPGVEPDVEAEEKPEPGDSQPDDPDTAKPPVDIPVRPPGIPVRPSIPSIPGR